MKNALADLNSEQRAAGEWKGGPLLIIAGPGTGKTKTLTARIAHLLQSGQAKHQEILALTFTNKAAREMKERVYEALGSKTRLPLIATFHAFAWHFLKEDGPALIDETSRMAILRSLKKAKTVRGMSLREISLDISRAKNQPDSVAGPLIANILHEYNLELAARHMQDFDDLLLRLYDALKPGDTPKTLPYTHILVDEFQDTNALQYEILKLLDWTKNAVVIGDPLQSIYGFRGADAAIFDRFEKEWPGAKRVVLTTNYRSSPEIVRMARAIFPVASPLQAYRQQTGKAQTVEVLNEYGEADWVIDEIERQIGGSDMLSGSIHHQIDSRQTFRGFAVLYRTHAAAKILERSLEKSGIPYQVAGEGSPYLDPAVQAVIQGFKYLAGKTTTLAINDLTTTQVETLLAPLKKTSQSLAKLAENITKRLDLSFEKHKKLQQFINSLASYDQMPLEKYLAHVDTLAEQEYYDPAAEAVSLLTIHAAKGLEFSRVFLIGAEEVIVPHSRKSRVTDLEEEKRLFYVAVTRARDELYLLHARTRQNQRQTISSFITALPPNAIQHIIDPHLAAQQQKAKRRALKRAQRSLF